jgi:hypothetical protein
MICPPGEMLLSGEMMPSSKNRIIGKEVPLWGVNFRRSKIEQGSGMFFLILAFLALKQAPICNLSY